MQVQFKRTPCHENAGPGYFERTRRHIENMGKWQKSEQKVCKPRTAGYDDLNKLVWEWFTTARADNIPMSGRMIQEQALLYGAELGHKGFSGLNGWLDRWQN